MGIMPGMPVDLPGLANIVSEGNQWGEPAEPVAPAPAAAQDADADEYADLPELVGDADGDAAGNALRRLCTQHGAHVLSLLCGTTAVRKFASCDALSYKHQCMLYYCSV
jgi:hypothetical protein